ncbi:hypothetical protein ES705_20556 [subsurface metagenome]
MSDMKFSTTVLSEPEIRVYVSEWEDQQKLHIRKFVETEKYTGPTKQGVAVPIDNVVELVQGILDVYADETGVRIVLDQVSE